MIPHMKTKDELDETEYIYDAQITNKKIKWHDWLLLNRPVKVMAIFLLATVVAPLLLFHFLMYSTTIEQQCLIRREARLPCGLGNVTAAECSSDCCYDHTNHFCFHTFPSRYTYSLNETWTEELPLSPKLPTVPYKSKRSLENIRISVDEVSATHLTLTFYKSADQIIGRRTEEKQYVYNVLGEDLNVVVNSTQGNIFNTAHGVFVAADDIWELTFKITNETMFGLGEIPLKPNTVKVIYNHKGGLSSIPLIFAKLNGSYHGLLIDTISPTEVNIREENQFVVRSITKTGLKFHLFVGPKPSDIMRDVMLITGNKTQFEYWMLGPHYCSETTLEELRTLIATSDKDSIPFESHCGILPTYFSTECNSTYTQLVKDGVAELRNGRRKFVPHVSPYIRNGTRVDPDEEETSTDSSILPQEIEICFNVEELEENVIRDPNGTDVYVGLVDNYDVIYPNYNNISEEMMKKIWIYGDFDGVILKNNWPLDESEKGVNQTHLFLPYFNENFEKAFEHVLPWNATQPDKYLYTHNDYGNQFTTAFKMIKSDVPIMSSSQWMNGNVVVNRQNVETSWSSLHRELIEASLGGISGHWYWSSPICGDTENFNINTQNKLCAKWYMAAAYLPMIQIISKEVPRDPLAFTGIDRINIIKALTNRMRIMTYLYAVLQEGPLLRPMFYQFPNVEELTNITTQFSVGDDLLIIPNLHAGQTHVHIWMPPGEWFEFESGFKIEGNVGQAVAMTTTESDLLTLVRGGTIIVQPVAVLSMVRDTKMNQLKVLVVFDCGTSNSTEVEEITEAGAGTNSETEDAKPKCSAKGKFYLTPDLLILFEADETKLKITAEGYFECHVVREIWNTDIWDLIIYGFDDEKNNNDYYYLESVNIPLCDLENSDELVHEFM